MFDSMVKDGISLDEAAQEMFKQEMYPDVSFLEHLFSMCSAKRHSLCFFEQLCSSSMVGLIFPQGLFLKITNVSLTSSTPASIYFFFL